MYFVLLETLQFFFVDQKKMLVGQQILSGWPTRKIGQWFFIWLAFSNFCVGQQQGVGQQKKSCWPTRKVCVGQHKNWLLSEAVRYSSPRGRLELILSESRFAPGGSGIKIEQLVR